MKNLFQLLCGSDRNDDDHIVETHISSLLICGKRVYKIKKPVNFGFLDFSSLSKRQHYCREEIRLNQRLAPQIYDEICAITGTLERPEINGNGEVLDYAVVMHRFDDNARLDRLLHRNQLDDDILARLAGRIAEFHSGIAASGVGHKFGNPGQVFAPMLENFQQIRECPIPGVIYPELNILEQRTRSRFESLEGLLAQRKAQGFIRECHGDMHLGNMAWAHGNVILFDGIEFSENLRWIDVFSDIAFVSMDLLARDEAKRAARLINLYLEHSGDFEGLPLLDFYQVYRAMVRAKVAALSLGLDDSDQAQNDLIHYINLAAHIEKSKSNRLILVGGYSATGKSTLSMKLLRNTHCIRLRSDRERKRLYAGNTLQTDQLNAGLYSAEITHRTYQHLLKTAQFLLLEGFDVIIDATLLQRQQRQPFTKLAERLKLPCHLLWLDAPTDVLIQRMAQRRQRSDNISDADAHVIEQQKRTAQPPEGGENVQFIDSSKSYDADSISKKIWGS